MAGRQASSAVAGSSSGPKGRSPTGQSQAESLAVSPTTRSSSSGLGVDDERALGLDGGDLGRGLDGSLLGLGVGGRSLVGRLVGLLFLIGLALFLVPSALGSGAGSWAGAAWGSGSALGGSAGARRRPSGSACRGLRSRGGSAAAGGRLPRRLGRDGLGRGLRFLVLGDDQRRRQEQRGRQQDDLQDGQQDGQAVDARRCGRARSQVRFSRGTQQSLTLDGLMAIRPRTVPEGPVRFRSGARRYLSHRARGTGPDSPLEP